MLIPFYEKAWYIEYNCINCVDGNFQLLLLVKINNSKLIYKKERCCGVAAKC